MSRNISQSLLAEFDHEMANTRKTLERVPEGTLDFRPHEKSMALGRLAGHLAELPMWTAITLNQDEFDVHPPAGPQHEPYVMTSRDELLKVFDENVRQARAAIEATADDAMMKPWTMKNGGTTVMTMPKLAVLRSFIMNHNVHHRAQLGVYLRLNDIPVPSIYGPSADEGAM